MREAEADAARAAQQADAEFERLARADARSAFLVVDLAERLGVTVAEARKRFDWLTRDLQASAEWDRATLLEHFGGMPRRELMLALAREAELSRVLFAPEPNVSPETTAGSDATSAADDAALTEAAVQSEADSREAAPDDADDANDAVAGPAPGDGATPRPKKKR